MIANVTVEIHIDAYAPSLNDGTVDVSEKLIDLLREHCGLQSLVIQEPEKIIATLNLEGDFKEIFP